MDFEDEINKVVEDYLKNISEDQALLRKGLTEKNWHKIESLFDEAVKKYQQALYDGCIETCEQLLTIEPEHFSTLCYLGVSLYHKTNYPLAIDVLTKCIKEDPEACFLWQFRGDCFRRIGEYSKSIQDYEKALQLEENGSTLDCLAMSEYHLGNLNNAYMYIDKAISSENHSDIPMLRKAQFLEAEGKIKEALLQYEKTVEKFPLSEYSKNKIIELTYK